MGRGLERTWMGLGGCFVREIRGFGVAFLGLVCGR